MLCAVYRSHQLITNTAQNRQGNCCTLWPALQRRNHPGQQKKKKKKKDPSEQIAAIRVDAISWHCFKCQQQTRYSLGRWWWRGVFRWTRGGNTTADTTMGPNWEGRLASFSMSFTLFCFENMTRDDELWIFWTILKIIRHTSSHVTVSWICIADTFGFYNWLRVTIWDVLSSWVWVNLAQLSKTSNRESCKRCLSVRVPDREFKTQTLLGEENRICCGKISVNLLSSTCLHSALNIKTMSSQGGLDFIAFPNIPSKWVRGEKKAKIAQNRPTGRLIFKS